MYEWPTFKVISVLKGSAKREIKWLTYRYDDRSVFCIHFELYMKQKITFFFSRNGYYLCSQGGEPDNTLTIWDWKKSKIVLRAKSHTQDVYISRFSDFMPDQLVTAGLGHIKFWKMAKTFTGLKLQGQLGRFGKTDISNITGIFSMPDEKVIVFGQLLQLE